MLRTVGESRHLGFAGNYLRIHGVNINQPIHMAAWLFHYEKHSPQKRGEEMIWEWLERIGMKAYLKVFVENGYDRMELVLEMKEEDLQSIGIAKIGHRRVIQQDIDSMRREAIKQFVSGLALKR